MTKYRIVSGPCDNRYLQFQTFVHRSRRRWLFGPVEHYAEEQWRSVPDETGGKVHGGDYLTAHTCPVGIPDLGWSNLVRAHMAVGDGKLREFAARYPDINVYFEKLRNLHAAYLAEKEARKNMGTVYL